MPDYQAIANEIDKTRAKLDNGARAMMALDILAMRLAKHLADDPEFDRSAFASFAGVPHTPTHLVSGEHL